jgi:hypothetical protein
MLNIMKTVKKEFRLPRVMIVSPSLALDSARSMSLFLLPGPSGEKEYCNGAQCKTIGR